MVRIKICGITNREDAKAAVKFGADALGFVFAESPRRIDPRKAAEIIKHLPPFITTVGLFVDQPEEELRSIAEQCRLDALQFHGNESPSYCSKFQMKLIKAFRIRDMESLKIIPDYKVDAYLLDSYVEGRAGGTGRPFDWDLAVRAKGFGRPVILAGGLTVENVSEAIRKVEPYGIDVSSSIESIPGKKDHDKMEEFIRMVFSLQEK